MTDEDRKKRLEAAETEIVAFCSMFGMKARREQLSEYRHCENAWSFVLFRPVKHAGKDDIVFEMALHRMGSAGEWRWTPKWRTAEKMLMALKRGPKMVWTDVAVSPAKGGSVAVTRTREYRLPKFSSIAELKLMLAASGSEFANMI